MITKNNSTNEIEIDKSLFIIEETNIANDKTKSEEQDIEETPDYEDDPPNFVIKNCRTNIATNSSTITDKQITVAHGISSNNFKKYIWKLFCSLRE